MVPPPERLTVSSQGLFTVEQPAAPWIFLRQILDFSQSALQTDPCSVKLVAAAESRDHDSMRILFIGDVVGAAGLHALSTFLPSLLSRWKVDIMIVNGENSADGGFGIT